MKYLPLLLLLVLAAAEASYDVALASKSIHLSSAIYNITKDNQRNNQCPDCYPGFQVGTQLLGNSILTVVGVDASIKSIVVVFRGSDNIKNFLTDARIFKNDYEKNLCKKCELHAGFYKSYRKLVDKGLEKVIAAAVKEHPEYELLFTGHSLGGAVALIAAVKFTEQHSGKAVKVYTFGQPRVGDGDYAKYADSKVSHFFRVVHRKDLVPHKPAYLTFYRHSGYEVWYRDGMQGNYQLCKGESDDCSNSIGSSTFSFSVGDHSSLNYIQLDDHADHQHPHAQTESAALDDDENQGNDEKLFEKEQAAVISDEYVEVHTDLFDGEPEL